MDIGKLPGFKGGKTVRNGIVGALYVIVGFVALPVLIVALPLIVGVAVWKDYLGASGKLAFIPGVSPEGGAKSALTAAVVAGIALFVISAAAGPGDTQQSSAPAPSTEAPSGVQAETATATQSSGATPGGQTAATSTSTPTATSTPTPTPTATPTPTSTPTPTPQSDTYEVRISYEGDWSGAVGKAGTTRSVDGSGTETFEISGNPSIISANAQKKGSGSGTLTVEILHNGDVVKETSTSAAYGVASTSYSVPLF